MREVEAAIKAREVSAETAGSAKAKTEASAPGSKLRPPGLLELEDLLGDYLDTRVKITMTPRHGRVQIDFANLEDLERIYRVMTQGPTINVG